MEQCLALNNPSQKRSVIEFSNEQELSMAADGVLSFAASLTHNAAQNLLHLQKLNIHMIHHTTLCPQIVDIIV